MPIVLNRREANLKEWMDDPECNLDKLYETYGEFSLVNKLLSNWKWIYNSYIKTQVIQNRAYSLLDIGFGGGDILRNLNKWAQDDGITLHITGIEKDSRAINYVSNMKWPRNIQFEYGDIAGLIQKKRHFDFVISNHLMHHLTDNELRNLLCEIELVCNGTIIFNDIERSDLGYLLFDMTTRFFFPLRKSFLNADGKISIRRSFTKKELNAFKPAKWMVKRKFPFRLLMIYKKAEI